MRTLTGRTDARPSLITVLHTKSYMYVDFYADDATFHTHSDNLETIEHSLQANGNIAKTWGKGNKMHIHYV